MVPSFDENIDLADKCQDRRVHFAATPEKDCTVNFAAPLGSFLRDNGQHNGSATGNIQDKDAVVIRFHSPSIQVDFHVRCYLKTPDSLHFEIRAIGGTTCILARQEPLVGASKHNEHIANLLVLILPPVKSYFKMLSIPSNETKLKSDALIAFGPILRELLSRDSYMKHLTYALHDMVEHGIVQGASFIGPAFLPSAFQNTHIVPVGRVFAQTASAHSRSKSDLPKSTGEHEPPQLTSSNKRRIDTPLISCDELKRIKVEWRSSSSLTSPLPPLSFYPTCWKLSKTPGILTPPYWKEQEYHSCLDFQLDKPLPLWSAPLVLHPSFNSPVNTPSSISPSGKFSLPTDPFTENSGS